jgi:hypothetical protein
VGRAIKSAPLIVDARHYSWLDIMASAGALVGLIGVAAGFRRADPSAGFAITVLIIHIGIEATRDVASRLMDENDVPVSEAVRTVALKVPGVREAGDIRVRWLGREVEVRMIVWLPPTVTLTEAHEVAHRVQDRVTANVPDVRDVMVEPAPLPVVEPARIGAYERADLHLSGYGKATLRSASRPGELHAHREHVLGHGPVAGEEGDRLRVGGGHGDVIADEQRANAGNYEAEVQQQYENLS